MKNIFLIWLLCIPCFGFGQAVDTLLSRKIVDSLLSLVNQLGDEGDISGALIMAENAKKISMDSLTQKSSQYLNSIYYVGYCYQALNENIKAEQEWAEALDIYKTLNTFDTSKYIDLIGNMAYLYEKNSKFDLSEKAYLETKEVIERFKGKESAEYITISDNISGFYDNIGKFELSEVLIFELDEIIKKSIGVNSIEYAGHLISAANHYQLTARYERSEDLYLESIKIQEKIMGNEDPEYATSLNNLGGLYMKMGRYNDAEVYFINARDIWKESFKVDSNKYKIDYAYCLANIAELYREIRNYKDAEDLNIKAGDIIKELYTDESANYASCRNNLAQIYTETGRYDLAEKVFLEVISIYEKTVGVKNYNYSRALNNLALVYVAIDKYYLAKKLYLDTKENWEKKIGVMHPDYAICLDNLGALYTRLHVNDSAALFLNKAMDIRLKIFGNNHPSYESSLKKLRDLYSYTSQFEKAESTIVELSKVQKEIINRAATHLSQTEILKFNIKFERNLEKSYSFSNKLNNKYIDINKTAFDDALFFKGYLLTSVGSVRRLIQNDSSAINLNELLSSYNRRLATQYSKPIANRDNLLIDDLEEKSNTLEKELTRSVAGFAEARRQVTWSEVRNHLHSTEAAIQFIHFRYYNPDPTDSILYAALVLLPKDTAPHFVPLCEQRQLDALIANPSKKESKLYLQEVYWPKAKNKPSLYSLLWAPLQPWLKGVKTVYYSPSGLLYRLNLGAIGVDNRTSLSDQYRLIGMGSTRQLVVPTTGPPANAASATALIYGGIRYEMDSTAIAQANVGIPVDSNETKGSGLFKYANPDSRTRGGEKWDYLPETAVEAENIRGILRGVGIDATVHSGYGATEESFKQLGKTGPSPRILHIATHGFFFPDPKDTLGNKRLTLDNEPAFKISEHPMIRSGLMLAGSKYAWEALHPMQGMEDGILTAFEISQMNLSNTELVVLSACETGLGDIQGNEGVYGLQRAFKIAGAQHILMSLWKVPDVATRELMTVFYQKWLEEKLLVRAALTAAQKHLRAQPKYSSPVFWAGFVLVE